MNRHRSLVAFGAIASLALLLVAARAVLAGPPPSQLLTFRDHRDPELVLTIEADPGASGAGMFALRVPARGVYLSGSGAELRVNSPTSTIARYAGEARLVTVGAAVVSERVVSVTLEAQLDPAHHTAQATLTVGAERFHLVQPAAGRGALGGVLVSFERVLAANDWRSLYALTTTDITASMSVDDFVARASAQQATAGVNTAVRRLAVGEIQTNPAGLRFVVANYAITKTLPDATSATMTYDAYFVLQGEEWKLWFTVRR